MSIRNVVVISTVNFSLFMFPLGVMAQEEPEYSNVYLNEVMMNPEGSDTDYEWVEIYNSSEEMIDISSCVLDSSALHEGTIIEGESYFIFAKDLLDEDGD